MDSDQQAGLAGVAMLVHDLLWWGGLAGTLLLLRFSLVAARADRDRQAGASPTLEHIPRAVPAPRGGHLLVGGGPGPVELRGPTTVPASPTDRLVLMAGATVAAAGVHAVMVLGHAGSGLLVQLFFASAAAAQAYQSWRLLVSPSSGVVAGVVALDAALLLIWAASRTVGVLGPVEAVGSWDSAVVVWQTTCLVLGVRILGTAGPPLGPPPSAPRQWGTGTQVALALTALTMVLLVGGGHG